MMRPLLLASALLVAGCSLTGSDGPRAESAFQMSKRPAFECGADGCGWSRTAVLTALEPDEDARAVDLVLDDGADVLRLYDLRPDDLPLAVGRTYTFEADLLPTATIGWPSLRVTDAGGLVLYATSEFPLSRTVPLLLLPPGWTLALADGGYRSQDAFCGLRTTPQVLTVSHAGASVRLVQGETARLGAYRVHVLIAQTVDYHRVDCADADAPELSVLIQRADA